MIPFEPPAFQKTAFNCPHCGAFAQQTWHDFTYIGRGFQSSPAVKLAFCKHCHRYSIWCEGKMVFPDTPGIQPPNPDLSQEIQDDYMEASSILNKSPRGAAALLRLCIQQLCQQLGKPGKNLNSDIAALVKEGLPPTTQKALDIVRVIGNNAVHPGEMDIKDDKETAGKLFKLVNLIAQVMITQPKGIAQLYKALPKAQKKTIEDRDKT